MNLKKGQTNICGYLPLPPTRKEEEEEEKKRKDFTIVSQDESFFFYDSLVRRVWIDAKKRPVVRIIGSHEISCLFGAVSMDQKQLFRQYAKFNTETFLDYLKIIHHRFPRCYLFMDKASITTFQIKEGERLLGREQGHSHTCLPTDSIS
jgi:hypothetical protein